MGYGALYGRSSKKALNIKSTAETELIGENDYLLYALWYIYFFGAQGNKIKNRTLLLYFCYLLTFFKLDIFNISFVILVNLKIGEFEF